MRRAYDIVIIGTGMGGGTLAYALRDSGARLLLLERGDFLPQEPHNWNPEEVFDRRRYKTGDTWLDAAGKPFHPGVHYFVGGNTKVYGAALPRLRRLPMPGARQGRRRRLRRAAGPGEPQRRDPDARRRPPAADRSGRATCYRRRDRARGRAVRGERAHRRGGMRRGEFGGAAATLGQRRASERPGQ